MNITNQFRGTLPEGFHLVEKDRHFLSLFYGEEEVAVFSFLGATPEGIEKAAEDYLRKIKIERR